MTHHGVRTRSDPDHLPERELCGLVEKPGRSSWCGPDFTGTADPTARKAAWDKMQALFYEQVPAMKVGDAYSYDIASRKLKGIDPTRVLAAFWNVSN